MFSVGQIFKSLFTAAFLIPFCINTALAQDILFTDSFEEGLSTEWTVIDNDGDGNEWGLEDSEPRTGETHLSNLYNASGNDDWIITPAIDLTNYTSATFSFWGKSYSSSYLEDFNVKLSASGKEIADFSVTLDEVREVPSEYTLYYYDLFDYAGQTVYLAIQHVSVDEFYLYLDDVEVTASTSGTTPTVVADFSADVTYGTAPLSVNFTDLSTNATSWIWDFDNDGTIDATANSSPSFTYSVPGTYSVSLSVSDGGGNTDSETKTDYITVTEASNVFTSTTNGGLWHDESTWVGNIVPDLAVRDIVLNGPVSLNASTEINDLTINETGSLDNAGSGMELYVNGTLINNGVIKDSDSGFSLIVYAAGDVINNGSIQNQYLTLNGEVDQHISMSTDADFTDVFLEKNNTDGAIVVASDLVLTDTRIKYPNSEMIGDFIIPEGSGFTVELSGELAITQNVRITGNGNSLKFTDGAYAYNYTYLNSLHIQGNLQVEAIDVYIEGTEVFVDDTLQNRGSYNRLNVMGDLNVNGVVRNNPGGFSFNVYVTGDVVNNGSIQHQYLTLNGIVDQELSMSAGADFTDVFIEKNNPASTIIVGSDLVFTNSRVGYPNNQMVGDFIIPESSGYTVEFTGEQGHTRYVRINGNGNNLKFTDGAFAHYYTYLSALHIKGTMQVDDITVYIEGTEVFIDDTLQNKGSYNRLNVTGDLNNNGVIRNNPNGFSFNIHAAGNVVNYGSIKSQYLTLNGMVDQELSMSADADFTGIFIEKDNTDGAIIAGSDLVFTNTRVGYSNSELNGDFNIPFGSGYTVEFSGEHAYTQYVRINGNGNNLKFTDGAYTFNYTYLSSLHIQGTMQVENHDVYIEGTEVFIDDTLQNKGSSNTLKVLGDLNNHGVIRDNPNGFSFYIDLRGNLKNYGDITNYRMVANGANNQILSFDNTSVLTVRTELDAVVGTGTYQWYKDGNSISNATGRYLVFETLAEVGAGQYYATTNEGNSRTITVATSLSAGITANFTSNKESGVAPLEVAFTDASIGEITSWSWDFGDGNSSEEQNPVHTYDNPGIYTVSLEVSDGSETDLITKTDFIQVHEGIVELSLTEFKISPSDGASSDNFGYYKHTDIYGDYAIVGAYSADHAAESGGSAYIFFWNGNDWVQQARLNASDAATDDWFGQSVAIYENYAVVGAPGKSFGATTPGSAYVYERSGTSWSQIAILNSDDGADEDQFGGSVDIIDGVIVVGASCHDENGYNNGAAYLFKQDGSSWTQSQKFVSNADDLDDSFGYSVALDGEDLMIANINAGSGSVYYYKLEGGSYVYQSKLTPSDGSDGDSFGFRMALDGNNIAISSVGYNDSQGKIYIFSKDQNNVWTEVEGLTIENMENTYYGHAIALDGNFLITGESNNTVVEYLGGAAYIYQYNGSGWNLDQILSSSDMGSYDYFGSSVAVHNNRFVIGAYGAENMDGVSTGAAYVYMQTMQSEELTADFTADVTMGEVPLTVQFTDNSTGEITSWSWEFGDGSTSTEQNPIHIYETAGTYTVSLEVGDGGESTSIAKVDFIKANPGEVPLPVVGATDWTWLNPLPQGNKINKVFGVDASVAYAVGGQGSLIKTTDGGANWEFVNTLTSKHDLFGVHFLDANTGYVSGYNRSIYKTTNAGESWTQFVLEDPFSLDDVYFVSTQKGFVLGERILQITEDGGQSWNTVETEITSGELNDVEFSGTTVGVIVGGKYNFSTPSITHILKTTDGGSSWILINAPVSALMNAVQYADANTVYAVGEKGAVIKSTDAGSTWSDVSVESEETFTSVQFVNAHTGYVFGDGIWKTTDGGGSWNQIKESIYQTVTGAFFNGNGEGFAFDEKGGILKSDATGNQWAYTSDYIMEDLNAVKFYDNQFGIFAGNNGTLFRTTDAGVSLQSYMPTSRTLVDVEFVNRTKVLAITDYRYLMISNDAGQSWKEGEIGSGSFYAIQAVTENTYYAVGGVGAIYKTIDGGETWTDISHSESPNYRDLHFFDENNGLVMGIMQGSNYLYKTVNGGESWTEVSLPTAYSYMNDLNFVNDELGFIVGENSLMFKTTNGGDSWSDVSSSISSIYSFHTIDFYDDDNGMITAGSGNIYLTNDGGENWIEAEGITGRDLTDLYRTENGLGFAVGGNGAILKYNPDEWSELKLMADFSADTLVTKTNAALQFIDQSVGNVSTWVWDFGDGNTSADQHPAHQYETPGIYTVSLTVSDGANTDAVTYIDYITVEIGTAIEGVDGVPEEFVLSQNYPNPFNPTTNIRFGLPNASHVVLNVYNLLGQKVLTLVNGTLPAGYHMKVLDGQQLSSGIYLYELKAGNTRLIEKMTLIK